MSTQYAVLSTISGQTGLQVQLFAINGNTALYTSDSVAERSNAKTQYLATFGEASAIPVGSYFALLSVVASGVCLASEIVIFTGTDTEIAVNQTQAITDTVSYIATDLFGACSNPQVAASLVTMTINGAAHSVQFAGQDATGVRTTTTLSKV